MIARLAILLPVLALGACRAAQPAGNGANDEVAMEHVLSSDGNFRVSYRTHPASIPLNEPFGVEVVVHDAHDGSVPDDIEFFIDGRMPHHRHGMLREPRITRDDDGTYHVTGMLFHMPGYWEIHFDVTRDGETERAQISLELE